MHCPAIRPFDQSLSMERHPRSPEVRRRIPTRKLRLRSHPSTRRIHSG